MNRVQLKYLAIVAMICDHIAFFFLPAATPAYFVMRLFGRITAPLMGFFLVEGFCHTSSRRKYFMRLLLFAILSQVPYSLAVFGHVTVTLRSHNLLSCCNVIVTLLLSFLVLLEAERKDPLWILWEILLILLSLFCDWGVFLPVLVLLFYFTRENRKKQLLAAGAWFGIWIATQLTLYWESGRSPSGFSWWWLGLFLIIPLICLYNARRGSNRAFHKWVFYILYPLQFIVIYAFL